MTHDFIVGALGGCIVVFSSVTAVIRLSLVCFVAIALCGCDPPQPAETIGGQPNVTIEKSSIIIPISVRSSQLNTGLNEKFNSAPSAHGLS
jgi:hypothetical protein